MKEETIIVWISIRGFPKEFINELYSDPADREQYELMLLGLHLETFQQGLEGLAEAVKNVWNALTEPILRLAEELKDLEFESALDLCHEDADKRQYRTKESTVLPELMVDTRKEIQKNVRNHRY